MSDLNNEFIKFAEKIEKRVRGEERQRSRSSSTTFEKIKWSGLEPKKVKVIRIIGGLPNTDEYSPRIVRIAKIKNDFSKFIKVVMPADSDYYLYNIINKIKEYKYDFQTKKKVYLYKNKFPELWNIIDNNNLSENTKVFGLEKNGWLGKEYIIFNCIDRTPEIYNWSKENKHTVLLSKNVYQLKTDSEVIEFAEDGISTYSFLPIIMNLIRYYGSWENYDIAIERTGIMNPPLRILHAVQHSKEYKCPAGVVPSEDPLTDEEKSWEKYNLSKLFAPSKYSKLYFNLKRTIEQIDYNLKTKYLEELEKLVEKEEKENKQKKQEQEHDFEENLEKEIPASTPESIVQNKVQQNKQSEPIVLNTSSVSPTQSTDKKRREVKPFLRSASKEEYINKIKFVPESIKQNLALNKLTEKELDTIVSIKKFSASDSINVNSNLIEKYDIEYKPGNYTLLSCFMCENISPDFFSNCPVCGIQFSESTESNSEISNTSESEIPF